MGNAHYVLLDDGPLVQRFADVVGRSADQLHAPLEGLLVRLGADKRRKKRVMDVDNALGKTSHEVRRKDLHVARQYHQFDVVLLEQTSCFRSASKAVASVTRNQMKGNAVEIRVPFGIGMIAHDGGISQANSRE